jgi:hypothetical protein
MAGHTAGRKWAVHNQVLLFCHMGSLPLTPHGTWIHDILKTPKNFLQCRKLFIKQKKN